MQVSDATYDQLNEAFQSVHRAMEILFDSSLSDLAGIETARSRVVTTLNQIANCQWLLQDKKEPITPEMLDVLTDFEGSVQ